MDGFIYSIATLGLIALFIIFIAAMVKPGKFGKFLLANDSRKTIALRSLLFLVAFVTLIGVFEPDSVKQARLEADRQKAIATQAEIAQGEKQKAEQLNQQQQENRTAKEKEKERAKASDEKIAEAVAVVSVVDSDTLKVTIDGKVESVRLVGINTPEYRECYANEATAALKGLVAGQKVRLERDTRQGDRDRYKRLLRFVFLEDGTHVNQKLIEGGYAYESLYSRTPHKYHASFVAAQSTAKAGGLGLWGVNTCNGKRTKPAAVEVTPAPEPPAVTPSPQYTAPQPEAVAAPAPSVSDVYYANCTAVRAAGAAPIYPGQPGFRQAFDRDNDGIGCE